MSLSGGSRSWHWHRHRHLLQRLNLLLGRIMLRRITTGRGIVARHWLWHNLWSCMLLHRIDRRAGAVLLHDHPSRTRCPGCACVHVYRVGSNVVLGGCDYYRGSNHGTLVSPSPTAHSAQREEHEQNEKDDNRNEDIHRLVVFGAHVPSQATGANYYAAPRELITTQRLASQDRRYHPLESLLSD